MTEAKSSLKLYLTFYKVLLGKYKTILTAWSVISMIFIIWNICAMSLLVYGVFFTFTGQCSIQEEGGNRRKRESRRDTQTWRQPCGIRSPAQKKKGHLLSQWAKLTQHEGACFNPNCKPFSAITKLCLLTKPNQRVQVKRKRRKCHIGHP